MSIIGRWYRTRELGRIWQYQTRKALRVYLPELWALRRGLAWQLLLVALLTTVSLSSEQLVFPHIRDWFHSHVHSPFFWQAVRTLQIAEASTLINALTAVVAVAAGIAAIVVGASMVVLDSAAQRYPASSVSYLANERSRTNILGVLAVTFEFSLISILIRDVGALTALFAVALALLSMNALLRYLQTAMVLFHAAGLSQRLAADIVPRIDTVTTLPSAGPGRSVSDHLRRSVAHDLARFDDLLMLLIERGASEEATDVLLPLITLLHYYLPKRHLIPLQSAWFPIQKIAQSEGEGSWEIRHMYEALALGPPTRQEPNAMWVEQRIVQILSGAKRAALDRNDRQVLVALSAQVESIALVAWHAQEWDALDAILIFFESSMHDLQDADLEILGSIAMNTCLRVTDGVLREGLQLTAVRENFGSILGAKSGYNIFDLPTEVLGQIQTLRNQLATERAIHGLPVTPVSWVLEELNRRLEREESERLDQLVTRLVAVQQTLTRCALDANDGALAVAFFSVGLQIHGRLLFHKRRALALSVLPIVLESLPAVLAASANTETHGEAFNWLRVQTLKALADQDLETVEHLIPALVAAIGNRLHNMTEHEQIVSNGMIVRELETLLVVGGLAYLAGEFTGDMRYLAALTNACRANGVSLEGLSEIFLPILESHTWFAIELGSRLTLEYHRFFLPYIQAIQDLPETLEGDGTLGFVSLPDHPSEFIRIHGTLLISVERCIEAFLRAVAPPISVQGEDQAVDPPEGNENAQRAEPTPD